MASAQFRCHISAACIQSLNGASVSSWSRIISDIGSINADPERGNADPERGRVGSLNPLGRTDGTMEDLS